jgi:hypothetical protein
VFSFADHFGQGRVALRTLPGPLNYAMENGPSPLWVIAALRDEIRCLRQYISLLEWENQYLKDQVRQCDLAVEIFHPTRIDS